MFQVTSSETMKCPSKEIDKNNISLLLPNHKLFIVSLNLHIRYVCFFWLSHGVFAVYGGLMCLVRESRVAENTPDCPQTPASVLFCLVGLRGCSVSLFLSDTGLLTCVCVAYPRPRSNPLPAPLWGRPLCLGSHIPPLKKKRKRNNRG